MLVDTIDRVRALGFGGLLGAGIMGILYPSLPLMTQVIISLDDAILIGAFLGVAFHRLIDDLLARPLRRHLRFYTRLRQLFILYRIVGGRFIERLIRKLIEKYFLEDNNHKG